MTTALVRPLAQGDPDEVEIVEHKGLGHPDTLCDGAAEAAMRALCRAYVAEDGGIRHHNVDKALLVGGRSRASFGGGEILEPMVLHVAGRAADPGGRPGAAREIVIDAARAWMRTALHAADVDRDLRIEASIRPGSADLVDLFGRGRMANDTSIGAGYAPLSPVEQGVLAAADALRARASDPASPEVGEDVKLLAVRRGRRVELTVACAVVARHVASLPRYLAARAGIATTAATAFERAAGDRFDVDVLVNAADDVDRGSVYLTVSGTSAEAGDDGEVGRGNRVNGLITPFRPMTLEAAAGKNPVTHVGKLYNLAAHAIARDVVAAVPGVVRAECFLASRIGRRVDDPALLDVRVALHDTDLASVRARVEDVARAGVAAIPSMWEAVVRGDLRMF